MASVSVHTTGRIRRKLVRLPFDPRMLLKLWRGQLLSIIVPVYNVEKYLDECLVSLRSQYYRRVEILVIDDGSPDGSIHIATRHALEDKRIKIISRPNGGLSAARNTGIEAARGKFLTFVDSDDTVTVDGFARTMMVLRRTKSDFAVMTYRRMRGKSGFRTPVWIARLLSERRLKTSLAQTPEMLVHAIACSKIFRRDFWDSAGLAFVPGMIYEDQVLTAEAYTKAKSVDLVDVMAYNWRETGDSITTVFDADAVHKRFDAAESCFQILGLVEGAASRRATQLATNDMTAYLRRARLGDDDYLDALCDRLPRLLDLANPEVVRREAPAEMRVLHELFRRHDIQTIHNFFNRDGLDLNSFPAGMESGEPVIHLPGWDDPSIARENFVLSDRQTTLQGSVIRAGWNSADKLHLTVCAYLLHVEAVGVAPSARAWLRNVDTGSRFALQCHLDGERVGHLIHAARETYGRSVFSVVIDPPVLGATRSQFELEMEVDIAGRKRRGIIRKAQPDFSAGAMQARRVGKSIFRLAGGAKFAVLSTPINWTLGVMSAGGLEATAVSTHGHEKRVILGEANKELEQRIFVRVAGRNRPVAWPETAPSPVIAAGPDLLLVRGSDGEAKAVRDQPIACIDDVHVGEDLIEIHGTWFGANPDTMDLALESARLTIHAVHIEWHGAGFVATLPTSADPWGRGPGPLPLGSYSITVSNDGGTVRVHSNPLLVGRTPSEFAFARLRGHLIRAQGDNIGVRIDKPRSHFEESPYGHRELRSAYQSAEVKIDPQAVYFQCYVGDQAGDSCLALHNEFRLNSPTWKLFWGVIDFSVPLPEGAIPLIVGTKDWYDVFATAKYLVKNLDFPAYYTPRPGQVHVQTFHGQPNKSMGMGYWRGTKHLPEYRATYETTRRSKQWDLILTANPESDKYYRDEYFYEGPIFNEGLPRTDALVGPHADEVRARTRQLLGIDAETTAILYAATFRDNRTTGHMSARDVDFLDMETLARDLGPSYVLLQRSHGAIARTNTRHGHREGVIDVTDYPDVNDLILASDAAILDYSSLRFDYALTGNPMVFFIPDYEEYAEALRGFLFDFAPTAPGPWVSDSRHLVETLGDLDGVTSEYADAYAVFNERFNNRHDGHAGGRLLDALLSKRYGL